MGWRHPRRQKGEAPHACMWPAAADPEPWPLVLRVAMRPGLMRPGLMRPLARHRPQHSTPTSSCTPGGRQSAPLVAALYAPLLRIRARYICEMGKR
jgi:hypothetical protein